MRSLFLSVAVVLLGMASASAADWKHYKFEDLAIYKDFPAPPLRSTTTYEAPLAKKASAVVLSVKDEDITFKMEVVDFASRPTEGANLAFEAAEREAGGLRGSYTVTDFPQWDHGANLVCGVEIEIENGGLHRMEDVIFNKGKLYLISATVADKSPSRHSLALTRFMDTAQFYLKGYGFNYATGHDYPIGDNDPLDRDNRPAAPGYKPPSGAKSGPLSDGPPPVP